MVKRILVETAVCTECGRSAVMRDGGTLVIPHFADCSGNLWTADWVGRFLEVRRDGKLAEVWNFCYPEGLWSCVFFQEGQNNGIL